jgi:GDP-mannose 6-dehydrogenase
LSGKGKKMQIYDPALRIGRLLGANLTYATDHLPHLAQLLVDDPEFIVSKCDVVIIARPMADVSWRNLPWQQNQIVIDLVGSLAPDSLPPHTEGLYW